MTEALTNTFLAVLKERSGPDLAQMCEHVSLPLRTPLFSEEAQPRYVHFMTSGLASVVTTMRSGAAVEVGMYSTEGFPEAMHLLGPNAGTRTSMMQVGGTALRMDYQRFRRLFEEDATVRELTLRLAQYEGAALTQLTACNNFHDLEERMARWLLMVQERVGSPELHLTQEFLGDMLGTRRSTVTLVAGRFQRAGLIEYSRGYVRIEQPEGLRDTACECYGVLKELRENIFR